MKTAMTFNVFMIMSAWIPEIFDTDKIKIKIKLGSFKSSEHINEESDGPEHS